MSCPICGKKSDPKYRPFCSRRCADVDLGRWLHGDYAVPAADEVPGEAPGEAFDAPDPEPGRKPH